MLYWYVLLVRRHKCFHTTTTLRVVGVVCPPCVYVYHTAITAVLIVLVRVSAVQSTSNFHPG